MPYNFRRKEEMVAVLDLIRPDPRKTKLPKQGAAKRESLSYGFVLKTPTGGIPALSGTTCGSAECTPYFIDSDGELIELKKDDGTERGWTVFNIFSGAIAGNTFITAKKCYGRLVADAEDCP